MTRAKPQSDIAQHVAHDGDEAGLPVQQDTSQLTPPAALVVGEGRHIHDVLASWLLRAWQLRLYRTRSRGFEVTENAIAAGAVLRPPLSARA